MEDNRLPPAWTSATVGEVANVNPRDLNHKGLSSNLPVTFVPMAVVDEKDGSIRNPMVLPLGKARKGHTQFKDNDIIFAKITPCMENGKIAIARNLVNGLGFGSTEFHVLRSKEAILPEFVFYYLRQDRFLNLAAQHMTGTVGQKRLPEKYIETASIPLPPVNEQKRIVKEIEELFVELRRARQALEKVPDLLRRLKRAMLVKAFRGELSDRNPNDEPATELVRISRKRYEHILTEKRNAHFGAWPLPQGWVWSRVDEIAEVRLGRQLSPKYRLGKHPTKYLRSANVLVDSLDLGDVKEMDFDSSELDTYQLRVNDVLLSEGSGSADRVGTSAVWDGTIPGCCFQNTLIRVRSDYVVPRYLLHYFTYAKDRGDFAKLSKGIGIFHLGSTRLSAYRVPLAPRNEQLRIVENVDAFSNFARTTKTSVEMSLRNIALAEQSVLAKAFRGKLVTQDPNDKPASPTSERASGQH